jgi:hypothetical protein
VPVALTATSSARPSAHRLSELKRRLGRAPLDELKADAEAEVEQRLDELELGQERSARQLERADVVRSDLFHQLKTARAEARVLEGENQRLRHLLENASAERQLQGRSLRGKVRSLLGGR